MSDQNALVDQIHKSPVKAVVITTGGGSGVFEALTHRGGGSATLISGRIPYSESESHQILGGIPDKMVCSQTARQLAMAAYEMAVKLEPSGMVVGLACTSSLHKVPSEREGRTHFIFCALQSQGATYEVSLIIHDARSMTWGFTPETIRMAEEQINVQMLLNLLAKAIGIDEFMDDSWYNKSGTTFTERISDPTINTALLRLKTDNKAVCRVSRQNILCLRNFERESFIFPGSFNPMHQTHLLMAQHPDKSFADLEISIHNVDKPSVDNISLQERLQSIQAMLIEDQYIYVWITKAATFVEKSKLFPNRTFIVGMDTAIRIVDRKYGNIEDVWKVFDENHTLFLVYGREGFTQRYLDSQFRSRAMFATKTLPNLSSTEIRKQQLKEGI